MVASTQLRADSAEQVVAEVTRIVCEATNVAAGRELPPEEPLSALGLDSLALVKVVAAVEARYGRELPDTLWDGRRGISIAGLAEAVAAAGGDPAVPGGPIAPESASVARPYEQPGVSRGEGVYLRLEARGAAGRAAAGALHRSAVVARWARAHQPCVVLSRDLAEELPEIPLPPGVTVAAYDGASDEPLAGIWPATQNARMRAHLRRRMDGGILCLAAWESGRIVAYDLLGPSGAEDVTTSPGTCFGLNLYERREARGRGIGLALLAASLSYTRDLGFARQATIVLERNRPMIAAATQLLGFTVSGRAERSELLGRVRWSWQRHGSTCSGPRLVI
jgi:acyl carrier protein/GNAT superfamily N-acetyltransferase